jgi:hypothetical protein
MEATSGSSLYRAAKRRQTQHSSLNVNYAINADEKEDWLKTAALVTELSMPAANFQ